MLKAHQAYINLEKNVLRIQGREVSFLAEYELPDKVRNPEAEAEAAAVAASGAEIVTVAVRRVNLTDPKAPMLTDHIDQLHLLAGALLEYETLSGDEIKKLIAGEEIGRPRFNTALLHSMVLAATAGKPRK